MAFDPDAIQVEQVFYPSKDGTKVPMFIVHKKGLKGPAPTLLYGYGGFNVSLTPSFASSRMAWMEQGGVFALAEHARRRRIWQGVARRRAAANKQNVFDDFIAAAE